MKKKEAYQKLFEFQELLSTHKCGFRVRMDGYGEPALTTTMYDGVRLINIKFILNKSDRGYEFVAAMDYELDPGQDSEDVVVGGPDLFELLYDLRQEYLEEFHPHLLTTDEEDEEDGDGRCVSELY